MMEFEFFSDDKRIALAVSGGTDSMVMLHMFAKKFPQKIFVVTVNHGIRAEADDDCRFVESYCKHLGVECVTERVNVPQYAAEHKLSMETAARILRYGVFDRLDCDHICLAHNADDNAETVLMHIIRGSGARGACGMDAVSGRYVRPLLNMTRRDIETYARVNNVPHVEDQTNSDTRYTRNFIRHKVMPLLRQLNPAAEKNILRFADNIRSDDQRLKAVAERNLEQVIFDGGGAHIPKTLPAQDQRLLDAVFCRLGVTHDVEKKHYDAIFLLAQNVGGKMLNLPFGFVAYNDYNCVTICPEQVFAQTEFEIPFAQGATPTPIGTVHVEEKSAPRCLKIDPNKVPKDAVFRTARKGDTFTKFGGGTKPLNRYLSDKKIPARTRDKLLLIAHGSEVLAIVGVEISQKLRVDDGAAPAYLYLTDC